MVDALERQLPDSSLLEGMFESGCRLPTADAHGANEVADEVLHQKQPWLGLHKTNCYMHKHAKTGILSMKPYDSEVKGLLYGSLSLNFAGAFTDFRQALKRLKFGANVDIIIWPQGEPGPGEEADRHREAVFAQYLQRVVHDENRSQSDGPPVETKMMKFAYFTKRMFNGRINRTRVEHWCRGSPLCHDTPQDVRDDFDRWVDELEPPRPWRRSSWKGMESPADFFGLLGELHDCLFEPYQVGVCGKDDATPPVPRHAEDESLLAMPAQLMDVSLENMPEHHDESAGVEPGELELPEPAQECSEFERQTTYRSSTLLWLRANPRGRLWALRALLRVHEHSTNRFIKGSGKTFEHENLLKRSKGEPVTHQVQQAYRGHYTNEFQEKYASLMFYPEEWAGMPEQYQTHDLAVVAYCSLAAAIGATEELLVSDFEGHLFGFELLGGGGDEADPRFDMNEVACRLIKHRDEAPCLLSAWWLSHVKKYPTREALTSPNSLAEVDTLGMLAKIDNITTELKNSHIRRNVYRVVQSKHVSLQDVSSSWVFASTNDEKDSLWGQSAVRAETADGPQVKTKKNMKGGGGGTCRAFVSKHAVQHRLANGKINFAAIMRLWRCERELAEQGHPSELWNACVKDGKRATTVARSKFKELGRKGADLYSNFGALNKKHYRNLDRINSSKAILAHADEQKQIAVDAARERDTALSTMVAYTNAFTDILSAHHGGNVREHLQAIGRLCKVMSAKQVQQRQIDCERIRGHLQKPLQASSFNLKNVQLSNGQKLLGTSSERVVTVRCDDNATTFAASRVTAMNQSKSNAQKDALELWKQEHVLRNEDQLDPLPHLSSRYKRSPCYLHGKDTCLCSGEGLIIKHAAQSLARGLLKQCPPKSRARTLLLKGRLVLGIADAEGTSYWHVCLMYLRPQRPTFVRMVLAGEYMERQCVSPVKDTNGKVSIYRVIHLMQNSVLPLDHSMTSKVYRIVGFDQVLPEFYPAKHLPIEPLDWHTPVAENPITWWDGRDDELRKLAQKEETRRAADERRKARQSRGEPRTNGRKKHVAPGPKAKPRKKASAAQPLAAIQDVPAPSVPAVADVEDSWSWATCTEEGSDISDLDLEDNVDAGQGKHLGSFQDSRKVLSVHPAHADADHVALQHDAGEDVRSSMGSVAHNAQACTPTQFGHLSSVDALFSDDDDHGSDVPAPDLHPEDDMLLVDACLPPGALAEAPPDDGVSSCSFEFSDAASEKAAAESPPGPPQSQSDNPDRASSSSSAATSSSSDDGSQDEARKRLTNTADRSSSQPDGCSLRRYEQPGQRNSWLGVLPPGTVDSAGRRSRRRAYGAGLRTEEMAISDIETWLLVNTNFLASDSSSE